eukprot:130874-Chlamydomonas_euryale.AAC.2
MSPNVSDGFSISSAWKDRVFSYVAMPPSKFWYERMTLTQSNSRASGTAGPTDAAGSPASVSAALRPSDEQSEIGQPWSAVENGHAPFDTWR